MLSQPISTVLPQIRENLKQLYGEQLDKLILFGSQARGTAQSDSDIDILIVLKDTFNYSQESEKISQSIADLCLENNILALVHQSKLNHSWVGVMRSHLQ